MVAHSIEVSLDEVFETKKSIDAGEQQKAIRGSLNEKRGTHKELKPSTFNRAAQMVRDEKKKGGSFASWAKVVVVLYCFHENVDRSRFNGFPSNKLEQLEKELKGKKLMTYEESRNTVERILFMHEEEVGVRIEINGQNELDENSNCSVPVPVPNQFKYVEHDKHVDDDSRVSRLSMTSAAEHQSRGYFGMSDLQQGQRERTESTDGWRFEPDLQPVTEQNVTQFGSSWTLSLFEHELIFLSTET